jgi:ABC-2 type transport system permease protein
MSWTRLLAVARKEIIQIRRDKRSLGIVLIMPVILMLLFGYGVNLDLKHLPIYVYDQEGSQQSQDLLKRFQASEYFHVIKAVNNYPEVVRAIDGGQAAMAVVVPYDFSLQLTRGGAVNVQAIIDATDDNTANVLIGYTQAIVSGYSQDAQLDWRQRHGGQQLQAPLSVDTRTWYNENLESRAFIVPGVLALVMSVIGAFLTSLTIAREWERGSMEQLISTPVTSLEILLGKLIPYFVIGLIDVGICAAIAVWWFQVPFRGSVLTLLVGSALFMVVVLCMGYFISVVAKNQLAASQLALVATFLPAFLLSGFLFSIEQMPAPVRFITHIVPARYYVAALKKIFLKGTPATMLYAELVPLVIFSLVLALLATRAFHKRLV